MAGKKESIFLMLGKPGIEPSTSSMSLKTSDYDALESSATRARFTALLFIEYIQNICLCTLLYALICNMLKKNTYDPSHWDGNLL